MHEIAIVGTGIAGLHLALFLQQHGLAPTLYAEHTPAELRAAPLPSTTALFGTVRAQMRQLGIAHWDTPDSATHAFDFAFHGMPQLAYHVPLRPAAQFIDMRLYLPRLLEDFAARGGHVVTAGALAPAAVTRLTRTHDLVVVASGRGGLAEMFTPIAERSPCPAPQRRVLAALVHGVRFPDPRCFTQRVIAGVGEVCEFQLLGPDGPVTAVMILATPGSALEPITWRRYDDDPAAFDRALYGALATYAPTVRARIADPARFAVRSARDLCQGSVTPIARRGLRKLARGRYAIALGDAHVAMDPLTAQGGNAAGKAAWRLGELIVERVAGDEPFDDAFCAHAEDALWRLVQPAAEWNLAALGPPAPHVLDLIAAAARNPAIATEITANFDDPPRQWELLRSPQATLAFIQLYAR